MFKPFFFFCPYLFAVSTFAEDWPQFRGPSGQGHSNELQLPITWNQTKGVAWKTKLPGKAWSSPICIDGKIFLTNAISSEQFLKLEVMSVDFENGEVEWNKTLFAYENQPRIHKKNSYASPTPFYDNGRIFVHFGNLGTACLEFNGNLIWKKKLEYSPVHGGGSSPVVFRDLLLLSTDGAKNPCLHALSKQTGEVKWRADRDSKPRKNFSFCTPLVIEVNREARIISPASDYVFAYDTKGKQLWKFNYPNGYSVVPRPVFDRGIIYVSSGYDSPVLYAIKVGGSGDITKTHLVWKTRRGVPRNSSVVVTKGLLFMASDNGVVSCLDSQTGALKWMERVAGACSPSLLYANGNLFLADENGKTFIFKAHDEYILLATNDLSDKMLASPIVYNQSLIMRTEMALWRIDP